MRKIFGLKKSIEIGIQKKEHADSFVTCKICGESFKVLVTHIALTHYPVNQYLEKYNLQMIDLYSPVSLANVQRASRMNGTSKEAISARSKFWLQPIHRKEKSELMKSLMEKRKKEGALPSDGEIKSRKKFSEKRKSEHEKQMKLKNKCFICGRIFDIQYLLDSGQIQNSRQVTGKFPKIKFCSKECRIINLKKVRREWWIKNKPPGAVPKRETKMQGGIPDGSG